MLFPSSFLLCVITSISSFIRLFLYTFPIFKWQIIIEVTNKRIIWTSCRKPQQVQLDYFETWIIKSDPPGISGRAQPSTFLAGTLITVSALQVFS